MLIIGSYGGADIDPAWVHNLRANPAAHVEVGTTDWDVSARELPPTEWDDAFAKILAAAPGFSENLANTSRVIPIFELQTPTTNKKYSKPATTVSSKLCVASHSPWRMAIPLPADSQDSHQNGGRVFLIFVADPRTVRSCRTQLSSVS